MTEAKYSVLFMGNKTTDGHIVYQIKVTHPDNESSFINKRYSDMRELHDILRSRYGDSLPVFPGKKIWGNTDPAFVASRQAGLQSYMNGVLQKDGIMRQQAMITFLNIKPSAPRTEVKAYDNILERFQRQALNLSIPPAPLDPGEVALRTRKYNQAIRLHVLGQPVDPIHLKRPGYDDEPVQLDPTNSERTATLRKRPESAGGKEGEKMKQCLAQLKDVLKPKKPITDKSKIIVQFPEVHWEGKEQ
eukprot:TRINITY_DN22578_c0_g1_i1.p1 TRINITY_DN22578_c0_g1~~TRINITY_DN22578_c0_g1_i1.p1  ORF type:complete len:246 (-),score=73.44 TRINITY_DN22578_c0_g1_i1:379-1116(-)